MTFRSYFALKINVNIDMETVCKCLQFHQMYCIYPPLLFNYRIMRAVHSGKWEFEDYCSNKGLTYIKNRSTYLRPQIPVRLKSGGLL